MKKKSIILFVLIALSSAIKAEEWVVPRLSPLPVKEEIQKLSLNGIWKFCASPGDKFWEKQAIPEQWNHIEVPGQWVMQGFEVEKGKSAGYFRTFFIPDSWNDKRIKLRCNGIFSESTIYVNGTKAGYHLGGFTPFEIDVTSLVEAGEENRIAVEVISESIADSAASASRYAVHQLGGITRDIYLFALSEVNLSSFHVSTRFDSTYTHATLTAEVEISNESKQTATSIDLLFTLTDASGKQVNLQNSKKSIENCSSNTNNQSTISFEIEKPEKWNSEHPCLYTFTCQLRSGGKVLQTTSRRIGFRQIEVRGNELFINDKPVKLRGVCRHEVMPLRGRSLCDDVWRKDVELFKKGNINYIRTSHYPPDEALLDACDELGMFVEVEAPFCWAHETKVPEDKHYTVLVNQHLEMVNRDKSHPSVIIWSLGNESNLYTEYFKKVGEIIKEIDPTRPRIFSQWGPDADNNELEIGNHHYPGPDGPDKYRNSKRPVIFDEFCHLNAYNRFELAADPGVRTMWGRLLDDMWNKMYNSKGVLGGALWAGIDDTFILPGGRTVGYGTWGPVDGWRREKPEYWEMKKAFSPVRIYPKQNMTPEGELRFDIQNRFNFTNLSSCRIIWEISGYTSVAAIELAPRSQGTFSIQVPRELRKSEKITFKILDTDGCNVDEYEFNMLPQYKTNHIQPVKRKIKLDETGDYYTVSSPDICVKVNKNNGLIDILKDNVLYAENAPALMILPINGAGDGIQMTGKDQHYEPYNPVCENWICHAISIQENKDEITITAEGSYKEATGKFIYTLTSAEDLYITYQFDVVKDISPRQIGIIFHLPEAFNTLSWNRQGYWNVYPRDHIGALQGETKVLNPELLVSGIAGPEKQPAIGWSYDQTKNGSNMFRSTKENIFHVILSDENHNFSIISNGTQHARAWKDNSKINLLIADYNNPGGEGFLSSHAGKYYRSLHTGDNINGTVHIILK